MNETINDTSLFAELYDFHPQGIVWLRPIWTADGKAIADFEFSYCNDEGLKYLNITREQQKGLRISSSPTLTETLRRQFTEEMILVYQTGVVSETNVYNPALQKYARVLRSRLRDGILTVVQDRTEENRIIKELEEKSRELQDQKTLLDNILKNSSNGISVSQVLRDESGKVIDALTVMANDAAVRYIGLPREIYLSKRATEIEPAVMGSPYYQACLQTLETGEPFVMQYRVQATNRWLELTVSKLDYDHLIHVFTDVTLVKEVQLQLEESAATLRTVFDAAQTGMFTFAPWYNEAGEIVDFRFVMVNETIAAFAGRSCKELEGQRGVRWFPDYLTNGEFELYKRCFESGEPQRKEIHYKLDGNSFFLDLQSVKIGDQLLVTITDQSSLRNSQLQLESLIGELQRSNKNLEEFAHAASHDLKEPIRKISVFSTRLRDSLESRLNDKEQHIFNRMQNATERMALLVDDLLTYSQVSAKPVEMEWVNLNDKLRVVLSDLEIQIEEKEAVVRVEELPTLLGYRRQLQQLFQNLITNALKYCKPGVSPRIIVRSSEVKGFDVPAYTPEEAQNNRYHCIQVVDNGIGFDASYAEQIFQLFYRLHGRSEYTGTGIGLSIARKVVENHQGYIWAESELGKGSTFNVLFPIGEAIPPQD